MPCIKPTARALGYRGRHARGQDRRPASQRIPELQGSTDIVIAFFKRARLFVAALLYPMVIILLS